MNKMYSFFPKDRLCVWDASLFAIFAAPIITEAFTYLFGVHGFILSLIASAWVGYAAGNFVVKTNNRLDEMDRDELMKTINDASQSLKELSERIRKVHVNKKDKK